MAVGKLDYISIKEKKTCWSLIIIQTKIDYQ